MIMAISLDLCTIDWTAVSAIVSFVMVFITGITLCHNKKQVNLMKEQWEAEHKPQLEVYFVKGTFEKVSNTCCRHEYLALEVANVGHSIAKAISLKFEIDNGTDAKSEVLEAIEQLGLQHKNLFLFPKDVCDISLCYSEIDKTVRECYKYKIGNLEVIREEYDLFCQSLKCIHVSGTYSDQEGNQYLLKTTLDPSIQKKKYVSPEDAILKVEEAINRINFVNNNGGKE